MAYALFSCTCAAQLLQLPRVPLTLLFESRSGYWVAPISIHPQLMTYTLATICHAVSKSSMLTMASGAQITLQTVT